jgi:hypothetical protein
MNKISEFRDLKHLLSRSNIPTRLSKSWKPVRQQDWHLIDKLKATDLPHLYSGQLYL